MLGNLISSGANLTVLLLGAAAIATGLWRMSAATIRRARADRELKEVMVRVILDHEDRLSGLDGGKAAVRPLVDSLKGRDR